MIIVHEIEHIQKPNLCSKMDIKCLEGYAQTKGILSPVIYLNQNLIHPILPDISHVLTSTVIDQSLLNKTILSLFHLVY